MEIYAMSRTGNCATMRANSVVAAAPVMPVRTRSMSGVGVHRVQASRLDTQPSDLGSVIAAAPIAGPDQQFSTHKFTTRSRPPTCSPPV
jgi:hypothetical protein